jgi:hypothetical protein
MFSLNRLLFPVQKYKRLLVSPALAVASSALMLSLLPQSAHAHAIAGDRVFPATLEVDDPSVATELSLPSVSWARGPLDDNGNFPNMTNIGAEFDLLVAPNFAVGISDGWNSQTARGERGVYGYDSIEVSGKYLFYENDEHEILMSAGLKVDIGGTGASSFGDDGTSTFTPTYYVGKGMGDLPDNMALLKPFAITGTLGVAIAQNRSSPDVLQPGITLQYSMPYLKSAVKDYDLPTFVNHLIPVVEIPLSVGLNNGAHTWGGTVNPGIIYIGNTWQFAVEASLPLTAGDQHGVGVNAQFHVFLDDLVPAFFQPLTGRI